MLIPEWFDFESRYHKINYENSEGKKLVLENDLKYGHISFSLRVDNKSEKKNFYLDISIDNKCNKKLSILSESFRMLLGFTKRNDSPTKRFIRKMFILYKHKAHEICSESNVLYRRKGRFLYIECKNNMCALKAFSCKISIYLSNEILKKLESISI